MEIEEKVNRKREEGEGRWLEGGVVGRRSGSRWRRKRVEK